MGKITQTVTGVTVGNVAVFADVNGNIKDGGGPPDTATGTVSSVSVATANGFAGTVANPTTTPAITIKTGVTGLLKGNGTAVSAAVADTDYQAPVSLTTTGSSGPATFVSDVLNIPTPAAAPSQVISGYVSGAGTVSSADTILTAIEKLNGNTALLTGAVIFQGTWNANTNTPTLASGVGVKGTLYKVSVAGSTTIDGISQWNVGDSIVFDGTVWDKIDGLANEVISVAGRTGVITLAQTDVSGTVATTTTVNGHALSSNIVISASDITTGTLPAAQLPNPSASTLGGVESIAAVSHNFLTSISTSGVPAQAQPAFTDISGSATNAQLPAAIIKAAVALSIVSTAIATNAALGNFFSVTLANGATTMSAPSNASDGQVITYELLQPSSGAAGTVTWDAAFAFGTAGAPTLTATNSKYDLVSFRYSSRKGAWLALGSALGF